MMMPDIERIGPDKDVIELLRSILAQHERILEINAQIVRGFMTPPLLKFTADKSEILR